MDFVKEKPLRRISDSYMAWSFCLMVVYFVTGKLGLALASVHPSATVVWPPTGITLFIFLALGPRYWPSIFLGAFLVNLTTAGSVASSLGIAIGNTLEGLLGAYLTRRYINGLRVFDRGQEVFKFFALVAMGSTAVSATIGMLSLGLTGYAEWSQFRAIWFTWWLGDAVGNLVIAPMLVHGWNSWRLRLDRGQKLEVMAFFTFIVFLGASVFTGLFKSGIKNYPLEFICLPPIVWAAFRLSQREAAIGTFLLSVISIWGTWKGFGPFPVQSSIDSLLLLQAFIGVLSITSLTMSAVVAQHRHFEAELQKTRKELELRVEERTLSLSTVIETLQHSIVKHQQTEDALRFSESRFRMLVETAPDIIYSCSKEGILLSLNPAFQKILGWSPAEWIGKHFSPLVHPKDLSRTMKNFQNVFFNNTSILDELRVQTKDGNYVTLQIVSRTQIETDGKVTGVLGIGRDITDRHRAEEKFRSLLEAAPDAMVIVNKEGDIVLLNKQTETFFGYEREELLGRPIDLLFPERFRKLHADHRRLFFDNTRVRPMEPGFDLRARRKDSSEFSVEISLSPLQTTEGLLITAAIRDVTDRKQAEQEILNKEKELARATAERQQLELFASVAAHDLQEPLQKVVTFGDLLKTESDRTLSEEGKNYLLRMQSAARRMNELITDLLKFSRAVMKRGSSEAIDLNEILKEAMADLELRVRESGAQIEFENLPQMNASHLQMREVFHNLLSNAIKFRDKKRRPHISVTARDVGEDRFSVIFQDNGIGFDEKYAERIFKPFERLHTSADFPGNGIGLAICQRLVARMEGQITVKSKSGEGSKFVLTFPSSLLIKGETRVTAQTSL